MRDLFWSYYPPTEDNWTTINTSAFIALDANAILHTYRLSPVASESWLSLLESLGERLWVPYQAAHEYQRNRLSVISGQHRLITDLKKLVDQAWRTLQEGFEKRQSDIKRSRAVTWQSLEEALAEARRQFDEVIAASRSDQVDLVAASEANDSIHTRISEILASRVGNKPDAAWIKKAIEEGKERYAQQIPPGWEDAKKSGADRQFGDLFIWLQIIEHAETVRVPTVLITEEKKSDWLRIEFGKSTGPLPELREEFTSRVGEPFWLYSVAGFMRAAENFGYAIDRPAVEDAEQLEKETLDSDRNDATTSRVQELIAALERLSDDEQVPERELRSAIESTLGEWLSSELEARRPRLTGPAATNIPNPPR
ncbi:MAG: PIN-like domain-containing protein [Candidatus Paceibacterota bacterium]